MPWLAEVSIGHAFTADALIFGFADAVRRYLEALGEDTHPDDNRKASSRGPERGPATAAAGDR